VADPQHQKNCVGVQHTVDGGGVIIDAKWFTKSCGTTLPYVCQRYAFDQKNGASTVAARLMCQTASRLASGR